MTGRTKVDWLVYTRIWDRVRRDVEEEHGEIEGYLSRTVEIVMREAIGEHRYESVERIVRDIIDSIGAEKTGAVDVSVFDPTEYTEKTRVGVYVDEQLLINWKNHVDVNSQYDYGVALSQHLAYHLQGGRPASVENQLKRVRDELEKNDDKPRSTAEEIINQLGERFSLEEFHAAARNAGVGTTKYALKQYLPRVINEMDVQPLPTNTDMFMPSSSDLIPDVPNPALLPYHAMSDDEKRLVVKIAAIKAAFDEDSAITTFSVSDGVAALDGRPQQSTVRALLSDLDDERIPNGISYDENTRELKLKEEQIKELREDHEDALSIITRSRKDDSATTGEDNTVDDWVKRAAELLSDSPSDVPDPVVNNRIVRAKYPAKVDEIKGPPVELCQAVTQAERLEVKEYLGWIAVSRTNCTMTEPVNFEELEAALKTEPDYVVMSESS